MIDLNIIGIAADRHAKLIETAESFDSRRFSVARKLMHGSLSASNDTLKKLTEETSKAINDLRTYEQSQFPPVRPHVMPNWANFYAEEKVCSMKKLKWMAGESGVTPQIKIN